MTLHIIMLAALAIGTVACAWWLHRAYQERRKRQIYEAAIEARPPHPIGERALRYHPLEAKAMQRAYNKQETT